jgi:hypothetical protein
MEPTESGVGMTPYEAWYGRKPSVDHLRTFGCVAHDKTGQQSTPMIMTGYEGSKKYRLCNPYTNKVVFTDDVVFVEEKSWNWGSKEPEYSSFHITWDLEYEENMDQPSLSLSANLDPEEIEGLGDALGVDIRPEALGILSEEKVSGEKASPWSEKTELEGIVFSSSCASTGGDDPREELGAKECPEVKGPYDVVVSQEIDSEIGMQDTLHVETLAPGALRGGTQGSETGETSALSDAEEYVVMTPIELETRQLRPTRARMRDVLDYYPEKEFWTVNYLVKMEYENQCLFIKGPVKSEGTVMDDIGKEGRGREGST